MLQYYIALTNVFWSPDSVNIRYWDTQTERDNYFAEKNLTWSPVMNFPINDNFSIEVTYLSQDNDIIKLLNCNYAVVYYVKNNTKEYMYYFAHVSQDSGQQMRVRLINDIMTNYFIGNVKGFSNCFIKRGFIDRFDKNGDNYDFKILNSVTNEETPFYSNNNIDITKKFTQSPLKALLKYDSNSSSAAVTPFDTATNATLWLYVYFIPTDNMNYLRPLYINGVKQPYVILCAPISSNYYVNTDTTLEQDYFLWTPEDIYYYLQLNNATAQIVTQKVSFVAPFSLTDKVLNVDYRLGHGVISYTENKNNLYVAARADTKDHILMAIESFDNTYNVELLIPLDEIFPQTKFTKNELTGKRNINANPFNLSGEVRNLTLYAPGGEAYTFAVDKILHTSFDFFCSRTPDVTRFAIKPMYSGSGNSNMYYNAYNGETLTFSLDESIPYAVEQLDTFLSMNKNFFQIIREKYNVNDKNAIAGVGLNLVQALLSTGGGVATGLVFGGAGGALAGGISGALSGVGNIINGVSTSAQNQRQIDLEMSQAHLTVDNYRAAPDTIKNLSTNIIFLIDFMGDVGILYTINEPIDYDFKRFDDYIFNYGYPIAIIDDISKYVHSRKNFDYLEADIDLIALNIPYAFKEYIRAKVSNGVRLLHHDDVDYINENYEVSLNE